jgi:hypothetical protein
MTVLKGSLSFAEQYANSNSLLPVLLFLIHLEKNIIQGEGSGCSSVKFFVLTYGSYPDGRFSFSG